MLSCAFAKRIAAVSILIGFIGCAAEDKISDLSLSLNCRENEPRADRQEDKTPPEEKIINTTHNNKSESVRSYNTNGSSRANKSYEDESSKRPAAYKAINDITNNKDKLDISSLFSHYFSALIDEEGKTVRGNYTDRPLKITPKRASTKDRIELSLREYLREVFSNNLDIKIMGFEPDISLADIIKAKAKFDINFFIEMGYLDEDQPSAEYSFQQDESLTLSTGLKKRFTTGANATIAYNWMRRRTSLDYDINPYIDNSFSLELSQPLLKGAGNKVNTADILKSENAYKINQLRYKQWVRDILFEAERLYWLLLQARCESLIQKELIENTKKTLEFLEKRKLFDVYHVQITRVKALLGTRTAELVEIQNRINILEEEIKVLLDNGKMNYKKNYLEIIPKTPPFEDTTSIAIDIVQQINLALDNREEINMVKLELKNADIDLTVAKNELLPKLDLVFRYKISGLEDSSDDAFDMITTGDYNDYYIGFRFEFPIGNRESQASKHQKELIKMKLSSELKKMIREIVFDVRSACKEIEDAYQRIKPSLDAVKAAEENLKAILAREIKLSPEYLEVQLSAQSTLAEAKKKLLDAIINYNIALSRLEWAKGTFLKYRGLEQLIEARSSRMDKLDKTTYNTSQKTNN